MFGSCSGSNGHLGATAISAISAISASGTVSCEPTGAGTITGVSLGTGLSGGGSSGNVSLAIASGYQLPQGCASDQLVQWT